MISDDQINQVAPRSLVNQKDVYLPFLRLGQPKIDEKTGRPISKMLRLPRKYVEFIYHLSSSEVGFEEAAKKSGMTLEQADRFWKRQDVQEWLADRQLESATLREWSRPEKWAAEGDAMFHSENVPKHKLEVWKEFGDRAWAKPSREMVQQQPKIVINIDPSAVQEALRRQNAIDGQIVKEANG